MTVDEQALVARARRGDPRAFEALVRTHAAYVYNLALGVLRDPQEAEDAAQDALVRVWQGLATFRGDAAFRTWLYRVVVRVCFDRAPDVRRRLALLPDDEAAEVPDERQVVERGVVDEVDRARVHEAIDALPEAYRMLITLRHLQELSYDEIAVVTGLPVGSVKVGIFRARRRLRAVLEGEAMEVIDADR